MTDLRQPWLEAFEDETVLESLRAAARACMAEVAEDPDLPGDCGHRQVDLMTPTEFFEWVELHVKRLRRERDEQMPHRLEPAGRPNRLVAGELRMAAAG